MSTILVVDDEPDMAELIAFNLRCLHHEVLIAADGAAALEQAQKARPDLLILDLMLPSIDGLSLCEMLRRWPGTSTVPILMLTACGRELTRLLSLDAGANDYMTKPFRPRELVRRVQSLLVATAPAGNATRSELFQLALDPFKAANETI